MNNSDVAKNGFKTFILTLAVSLIVFSTIYYVITSRTGSDKFEAKNSQVSYVTSEDTPKEAVEGASTDKPASFANKPASFGQLADAAPQVKAQVAKGVVLSGSTVNTTQTTQSTSINTGVVEITVGLFISLALFLVGFYVVFLNPRKLALIDFERSITKKL
jgi:hypothetical protein